MTGPADAGSRPVAIVTGAARRIGLAIAGRLAREGYAVLLHASPRSVAEAEARAAELRHHGLVAGIAGADLAEPNAAEMLLQAGAALGPLHLLVNSASLFAHDTPDAPDVVLLDRLMAVNLRAPALLTAAFAKCAAAGGSVVNILDQRVLRPNPLYFSYTLSKAALAVATVTAAQALARRGIRVNAVAPGPTLPSRDNGPDGFAREVAGLPLPRPIGPDAIADAVLYLARATGVTGTILPVDGGQHLGWETPDILGYEGGTTPGESP